MSARTIDWLITVVLCALAALFVLIAFQCDAQADDRPVPAHEWHAARLALAHAVQIEGGSDADAVAILHVLAYRWKVQRQGWSLLEQVTRYVRPLWMGPQTPRQRRILWGQKVWEDVPRRVRVLLERWARGDERSPCKGAVHWAGRGLPTPLRPVVCDRRTWNRFYRAPI